MELDIFDKYNEEAYEKVKNMLKTNNVASVVHPDFTRIEDIGVKFISETAGRTLCLEQRRNKRGKIQQKIERLIREGKISEEKLPRYKDVEFVTYSELMTKITSGESELTAKIEVTSTVKGPVGPEICVGVPPNNDAKSPTIIAP